MKVKINEPCHIIRKIFAARYLAFGGIYRCNMAASLQDRIPPVSQSISEYFVDLQVKLGPVIRGHAVSQRTLRRGSF